MNLTLHAHSILRNFLESIPSPIAIDATCGNGHDTLALTNLGCTVFAFDIQAHAVEATRALLEENNLLAHANIFEHSHADMISKIPQEFHGKINAAVFNLGWLPKSDKRVITNSASTLAALESLKGLLNPQRNLVSLLAYRGHDGGNEEFDAVREFAQSYNPRIFGDTSNEKSPILFTFAV